MPRYRFVIAEKLAKDIRKAILRLPEPPKRGSDRISWNKLAEKLSGEYIDYPKKNPGEYKPVFEENIKPLGRESLERILNYETLKNGDIKNIGVAKRSLDCMHCTLLTIHSLICKANNSTKNEGIQPIEPRRIKESISAIESRIEGSENSNSEGYLSQGDHRFYVFYSDCNFIVLDLDKPCDSTQQGQNPKEEQSFPSDEGKNEGGAAEVDEVRAPHLTESSKPEDSPHISTLKPGAPFLAPPLPRHYVHRPEHFEQVKATLLSESPPGTLVISAIYGMGGIGKSVLAAALAQNDEIKRRFPDGVLWVTLGQQLDMLSMVHQWIWELGDYDYKPTTLDAASLHLRTLLADQQALLVVDDVWKPEHVEPFRIGGAGCCVLVTTRQTQIVGAKRYDLDLMTPEQSLALLTKCLPNALSDAERSQAEVFAKEVGYLPLALELAAARIEKGVLWQELIEAFQKEMAVLNLDRRVDLIQDESIRKQRSLLASFKLTLKLLAPQELRQFAWLGIVPEDVSLTQEMGATLWDVAPFEAGEILRDFKDQALLLPQAQRPGEKPTYRIHDLVHDLAKNLLAHEQYLGDLPGLGLTVEDAHRQFLERYQGQTHDGLWHTVPYDGYIHRHLAWHFEQAQQPELLHQLLQEPNSEGRNGWYEACERLGQTANFVTDVARAWQAAEAIYKHNKSESIVLQCRYALIMATLNSLATNLPIGMMAEFVKQKYWIIEQAWAYVEQMQDEQKRANAIQALAPYLTQSLFQVALDAARGIQAESRRADVLRALASVDGADFAQLLEAARGIQDESRRADVLRALASVDGPDFAQLLEAARGIQAESRRADVLRALASVDGADFAQLLEAARGIQAESRRADVLRALASVDQAYFTEALDAARGIQAESRRADVLSALASVDGADFAQLLDAARGIQAESRRADVLRALASVDGADFAQLLDAARGIQAESSRADVLRALASVDGADFAQLLEAARGIQDESRRTDVLRALASVDGADFAQLLDAARGIQAESRRADVLRALASVDGADFAQLLEAARGIQDESRRTDVLRALASVDQADFAQLLDAARGIQAEYSRASVLSALASVDGADFAQLLDAAWGIQAEDSRADVLSALASVDGADFAQLLDAARGIQDEYSRADVLRALAKVDQAYFTEALEAARGIQAEDSRADVLSALASVDQADFAQLLDAARGIQAEYSRAYVLSALASVDQTYFTEALEAARGIQAEDRRAYVLSALASVDQADFAQLLDAARGIQAESRRAYVLSALASVDQADFAQLLEAARGIQAEDSRASVLSALASVDQTYFTEALEAARGIQAEDRRAYVLSALASVDQADFAQSLEAARGIQAEDSRAYVLSKLAEHAPQGALSDLWKAILAFKHKPSGAKALSQFLPRFIEISWLSSNWRSSLHLLASRKRSDLMQDLATLYPVIRSLGGETAMRGVVDAMSEVCKQWK